MDESTTPVRVTTSRARDHVENSRFRAGDGLVVGHRNQQHPEFVWCATEDGHAGWAPDFHLEMTGAHEATGLRDYDATELTVEPGELLDRLEEAGGWLRCRTSSGHEGWVPADNTAPAD